MTTRTDDGEQVTAEFPPTEPIGVEDPAQGRGDAETRDDMTTREWRREPENDGTAPAAAPPAE